ncbi:uncharacterized protein METZ01_LOCUS400080, partial [marine metagenome]
MWYEIEMIEEYVESLRQLVEQIPMEHRANIYIDFYLNVSQHFEKMESDSILQVVKDKFTGIVTLLYSTGVKVTYNVGDEMYFIGDYRRDFNNKFAPKTDFLIWGESDCLLPKQTIQILKSIKDYTDQNNIYRYIVTFAVRKMWDDSW